MFLNLNQSDLVKLTKFTSIHLDIDPAPLLDNRKAANKLY